MKKLLLLTGFLMIHLGAFACEVCKKQQPKMLSGITHGAGPQSEWDYIVVWATVVVVAVSFFYGVKWSIKPKEKESTHIKRIILNFG